MTPPATASASGRRWPLDVMRIVAVVGVAAIHTFGAAVSDAGLRGSLRWWFAVAVDIGFIWVVPLFVMLSGALILAPRQYADGSAAFYRRRLLRLAPAFVFWQVFYIVAIRMWFSDADLGWGDILTAVLDGRTYTHLYFLWLIVGLYAVAPVLAAYLHAGGPRRATVFATVVIVATTLTWSSAALVTQSGQPRALVLMALTQWLPYVGYFLAGWALRDVVLRGAALAGTALGTLLVIAVLVWQYGTAPDHPLLNAILPVAYPGPLVAVAAVGVFLTGTGVLRTLRPDGAAARVLQRLSDAAFGVFLIHFAVLLVLRTLPVFADHGGSPGLLSLLWGSTVVLSFALVIVLRLVPGVRRLL